MTQPKRKNKITTLGERILIQRRRLDLTQEELGRELGLSGNTIARIERGLIQDVKSQVVRNMAELFDVSAGYLLGLRDTEGTAKDLTPAGVA